MKDGFYRLPPVRFDSEPMQLNALSETIDWGVMAVGIPDEWKKTKGKGAKVVVLDTGAPQHSDLPNPYFDPINTTSERFVHDANGHHTHCSGIIGARQNSKGVVGVAPECEMGHIKVMTREGRGQSNWIAAGFREARKHEPDILSVSIGGGYDRETEYEIEECVKAGILVFAAAGNSGFQGQNSIDYPGKLPSTICVASYRRDGQISRYSSGGDEVDMATPGEEILSTFLDGTYRKQSGTSMATPFAAGLAALMIASRPDDKYLRTPRGFREEISKHSTDKGELGKDVRWGFGIPIAKELVNETVVDDYWFFR